MSATFDDLHRPRHDGVTIPTIVIWMVLSVLLHVALLLWAPPLTKPNTEEPVPPPLTAYLQSAPQPPAPQPPMVVPPPPRATRATPSPPKQPAQPAQPPAPVIALAKPQPAAPSFTTPASPPEPPPKPAPQATTPPPEADFAAMVAARRRARGEEGPPSENETANRGTQVAAASKTQPTITFGERPPTPSGGLFQIRRRGYDYAEFMFFGWNQNFGRAVPQLIEVRKDGNADIDIAVVRRIIALIRDHERGDFQWYSRRIGKNLTLSARARDNAGLEEFMLLEFYEDLHRYR
jgi:outer membrane biosynthesis protein TonB